MWAFALATFVVAVLCVVAFVHGASTAGPGDRATLDIGRESADTQHQDAA